MSDIQLSENMKCLLKDLMLQKSLEDERKVLEDNGIIVDEESLKEWHRKKVEFFSFVEERDKIRLLDEMEMKNTSGGKVNPLLINIAINAVARAFTTLLFNYACWEPGAVRAGSEAAFNTALQEFLQGLYRTYWLGDDNSKKNGGPAET